MIRKLPILLLLGVTITSTFAQKDEKEAVKQTVEHFFEAFHKQDSTAMKSFVADGVLLQTTGRNKEGKTQFKRQKIEKLYESIVRIPDSVTFQEKLTSWNIQVDRTMANAWVGYEFWLNGTFSHCGINSFQLINFDGAWKIVYLIDTRGKAGCLQE
ncbi:MAG: nuclear transport factor 2 family protein [Bacteroidota bacterium]